MIVPRLIRHLQRFDWLLFIGAVVLFIFGLAAIYSVELSRESAEFVLVKKQLIAFVIGMAILFIAAITNYSFFRNWGRTLYLVGVLALVLVLIFGTELNGTKGWFIVAGFSFQPIEFMKFALAVQLARYFGEHARRRFGWREIFGSGFLVAVPVVLTMMQPDAGSAMLLIGMWVLVMFFAGIKLHHVAILAGVGSLVGIFSWFFVLVDYQKNRILTFIDPASDPLDTGYNVTQAKIAIGSGQLFGRGLGFGSQSQLQFLPESQTDFIFAVIAEELGFFGVVVILSTFALILWRLMKMSSSAQDNFTAFLAAAFFSIVLVQMTVNIGVNLSLLPATGISLPYVSYGGSALLIYLLIIGVAESVAVR